MLGEFKGFAAPLSLADICRFLRIVVADDDRISYNLMDGFGGHVKHVPSDRWSSPSLSHPSPPVWIPNDPQSNIAYLVNVGTPVLLTGDASHFAWAFKTGVARRQNGEIPFNLHSGTLVPIPAPSQSSATSFKRSYRKCLGLACVPGSAPSASTFPIKASGNPLG